MPRLCRIICLAAAGVLAIGALGFAEAPQGVRGKLTTGELFIPDGYTPAGNDIHLVMHLHGAAKVAEANLAQWGEPAVLVSVILNGLSQVYTDCFRDPAVFATLLTEAATALKARGVAPEPVISRLTVTSFSAGFGGVREMLKSEAAFERIDALVMADTIYAGYVGDPAAHQVNPAHMTGFLRFAREAAAGHKAMVISHCDLDPGTYASTRETADYLIAQLGTRHETAAEAWAEGLTCTSQCAIGRFQVFGFTGTTGPDHMRHLHNLWRFMRRLPPPDANAATD